MTLSHRLRSDTLIELPFRPPEACRVLLVEDNAQVLEFLANDLSQDGYQMLTAMDGERALEIIRDGDPDVVVLDVNLPGIDGITVCQRLRSEPETRFLPVILVTGDAHHWRRGIEAGANEFLEKPVDTLALSVRVRSLMRTKQLYDEVEANQRDLQARIDAATRELREAYARVEALSKIKSNVLALFSHEFRTPLLHVKLALEIVMSPQFSDDYKALSLEDMAHAVQVLQHRIQDIEEFSDPTSIHPTPITAPDLVYSAIGVLQERRPEDLDRVHLHLSSGLPPVRVDHARIQHALAHLIENGIKFASPSPVDVIAERAPGGARIIVRDYGPGIPEPHLQRLYEPFQQAEASFTRSRNGLGIGLALAKVTLDAHGSQLQVETGASGTSLSFVLPEAVF